MRALRNQLSVCSKTSRSGCISPVGPRVPAWAARRRSLRHTNWRTTGWAFGSRFRHIFSGTPQRWSFSGADFFLLLRHGGRTQVNLFIDANDLLSVDLHGLNPDHLIAYEAHKIDILRGDAVNPFFVFGFLKVGRIGTLAQFLRRASLGKKHHFPIHTHQHVMVPDRRFYLRRDGL